MSTSRRTIKTPEALAALTILRQAGFAKRPALQRSISAALGREISDDQFEATMTEIGSRIIRTRGQGGGIRLF